jgi:hypothetical protein
MSRSLPALLLLASCGPLPDGVAVGSATASLDELSIVAFVNVASFDQLDTDVGLDARAARNLVDHVDGPDGRRGSTDDAPFTTLADVDDVPYVGPAALLALDEYVRAHAAPLSVEGVSMTFAEAALVVALCNSAAEDVLDVEVGLDARAAAALVEQRPHADIEAVAAVPYVGPAALTDLLAFVAPEDGDPDGTPGRCSLSGGTFDGVSVSAQDECHAVRFMNRARFSDMRGVADATRRAIYDCAPDGSCGARAARWERLSALSDRDGVSQLGMDSLVSTARQWQDDGGEGFLTDTVDDVVARRQALVDGPVHFDKVFVSRRLPDQGGVFRYECVELKDTPSSTASLAACLQYINAANAPGCTGAPETCLDPAVGATISLRGTLRQTSGGSVRLHMAHTGPGLAHPSL